MATDGVFISYRREETAGFAGRLYDRLVSRFGRERIFMDVEGIDPGVDFVEAIERAVASCRALVVVIGPGWSSVADKNGNRRLDDPQDFVRLETAAALRRSIRVLPVLVNDANMPREVDLPEDLKALVRRQAIEINHKHWESSTSDLLAALSRILDEGDDKRDTGEASSRSRLAWASGFAGVAVIAGVAYFAWMWSQPQPIDTSTPESARRADSAIVGESEVAASETESTSSSAPKEDGLPPLLFAEPVASESAADLVAQATTDTPGDDERAAAAISVDAARTDESRVSSADERRPVSTRAVAPRTEPEVRARPTTEARSAADPPARAPDPPTPPADSRDTAPSSKTEVASAASSESSIANATPVSRLPQAGEQWAYSVRGLWATNRNRSYVYTVEAAQGASIRESMSETTATGTRSLPTISWNGSRPEVIQRQGTLPEFNPYLVAFEGVTDGSRWRGVSTPAYDGRWDGWNTSGRVVGLESVTVPAGEYRAWKADIWSNRNATGGPTIAGLEPVSVRYEIWFAPGEKRFVKLVRTIKSAAGGNIERDTFELRSVKRP